MSIFEMIADRYILLQVTRMQRLRVDKVLLAITMMLGVIAMVDGPQAQSRRGNELLTPGSSDQLQF